MRFSRLLILLLALSPLARADFLIEPYAGYQSGKYSQTISNYLPSPVSTNLDKLSGYGLGLRLGLQHLGVMLGGEYAINKLQNSSGGGIEPKDLGAFFGYEFAYVRLRFFGTYFFKVESDDTEGDGYKLGAGLRFLPYASLNVEWIRRKFDTLSTLPAAARFTGESTTTQISISFPIHL